MSSSKRVLRNLLPVRLPPGGGRSIDQTVNRLGSRVSEIGNLLNTQIEDKSDFVEESKTREEPLGPTRSVFLAPDRSPG